MMKKRNLAAVGFEPTPPKRMVPLTSALDQSTTLPDVEPLAILMSFHFVKAKLVIVVDLYMIPREKCITRY